LKAAPVTPRSPLSLTNDATRLRTIPAATQQLIIVSSDGYAATTATVETFTKASGHWQPAFPAMSGRIGTKGFSDHKVEGDLTTPTGVYGIGSTMYGIAANPGVHYAFHQLVPDDYWNENPASAGYNSFAHGSDPGAGSEALWQIAPQYNYFAVINYNIPVVPASPALGSAIFLHVMVPGHATAGCVALAQADLLKVLQWLDPGAAPLIVMAPTQSLSQY
jgi:L,D-peptidoglycan transpeptidase YkuD (ErfK/YbiS/YcfS/YnhG family)